MEQGNATTETDVAHALILDFEAHTQYGDFSAMESTSEPLAQPSSTGFCDTLLADAPWHASSFKAAAATTVAGIASWIGDFSSPALARIGGSYLGGYFIGWALRHVIRLAALLAGGTLVSLSILQSTGWIDLDWAFLETQVGQGISSLHQEADRFRTVLSAYLPSAWATAAGVFFGLRRK